MLAFPRKQGKELSVHRALAAALPDADPVEALQQFGFGEGHEGGKAGEREVGRA